MTHGIESVSIAQLLGIWAELVEAYHGVNGFGADVAEIYAYRLNPDSTRRRVFPDSPVGKEAEAEAVQQAAESLLAIVKLFESEYGCKVDVMFGRDKGRRMSAWFARENFNHRVHLRVVHQKPRKSVGPIVHVGKS